MKWPHDKHILLSTWGYSNVNFNAGNWRRPDCMFQIYMSITVVLSKKEYAAEVVVGNMHIQESQSIGRCLECTFQGLGSCQQLSPGRGWNRTGVKRFGELKGAANLLMVHREQQKLFWIFHLKHTCQYYMTQQHNRCMCSSGVMNIFWMFRGSHKIVHNYGIFQSSTTRSNCWQLP